jgi:AbrB family transcriptional regulator (stage V sporulation protein T)
MDARVIYIAQAGGEKPLLPVEGVDRNAGVAAPIISAGDVIGAVCIIQPESGAVLSEGDIKLAQVAAAFLGKQMEE